jgi:parvulin-like peptidyl-prolyl isomerase
VSAQGVPADASLDLDPAIAAATLAGKPGDIVGPTTDSYGRIAVGKLLPTPDTTATSRRIPFDADKAKLDTAALQSWADGQVLRRTVTAHLIAGWFKGVSEAHFRELVVGSAPDSSGTAGPWVELSGLAVDRLKGVTSTSIAGAPANLDLGADSLAKTLKSMTTTDRTSLFRSLVTAANRSPAADTTSASGELGFYSKDGLVPDAGKAAFADSTHSGDVIGPIATTSGPELFLVEARYGGTLDDHSKVALGQVRADAAPDLAAYTKQYSPADVALATDAGWRAEPEFGSTESVRAALFDTAIGTLSDPFVLDGKLALAIVSERKTAVPDARAIARLTLDGYDAWFGTEFARAKITRSDHPLPELEPSASPSPTAAPALPSAPVLDTPNVPQIPGGAAATPVRTDAMGLPALP